jgi:hypothetical protein
MLVGGVLQEVGTRFRESGTGSSIHRVGRVEEPPEQISGKKLQYNPRIIYELERP